MFTLFNTLVYLLLLAVGLVLLGAVIYKSVAEGGDAAEHATAYTLAVAGLLLLVYGWMLATFLPGLAVRVRRLHDIGLSGKWLLGYYALIGSAFIGCRHRICNLPRTVLWKVCLDSSRLRRSGS